MAKTIVVTGASRGIGMAICEYLLNSGSNVVAVARTEPPLQELHHKFPGRVAVLACDLKSPESGRLAVHLALEKFGSLDGLIVNHGMVEPVERIADASLEKWRSAFDTNVFSVIELIKAALPDLREHDGNIILTSSGAAVKGTSAWGCYSAGKAVYNSLARTLAAEEPSLVTIAIRPGVVDTEMQSTLAIDHFETMDEKDANRFRSMKAEGKMLRAEQPGNVIARLAVGAAPALSGQFIDWNSPELSAYQDAYVE